MDQDRASVFDLAAQAAASNGGNNDLLLPPPRFVGSPQKPSAMPYNKYVAYNKQVPFDYPQRTWPGKTLKRAPRWCSVDLRDGNQALVDPMDSERKLRFWNLLISMGFKEIEVGFPSASETDYDFIRLLIERELIPDDVTIVVLTQAREHLIRRTYEALRGAKRAVVHFYNSVSVLQREVVFHKDKAGIKKLATDAAELCRSLEADAGGTDLSYEYSPESFSGAEPEYSLEVCNAVIDVIRPTPEHPMIINLPNTVEMTTPNVFADEVEYISTNLKDRDAVVLSLHPHNDEGMAVAATELSLLAGADRVEGCLLGNGERTGNVDICTVGLNLLVQGIDPQLDFSDMPGIRRTVGKGGMAYLLKANHHLDLPKRLQVEFERLVQGYADRTKREVKDADIWRLFKDEYLPVEAGGSVVGGESMADQCDETLRQWGRFKLLNVAVTSGEDGSDTALDATLLDRGLAPGDPEERRRVQGHGNGPIAAFLDALKSLDQTVSVLDYAEHAMTAGTDALAASYVECRVGEPARSRVIWGVGIDSSISTSSLKAIISALNRFQRG